MANGKRIVVITADVLSKTMAGPAIRAVNIAATLAAEGHDITLVSTAKCEIERSDFRVQFASWMRLRPIVDSADVVIAQGFVTYHAPFVLHSEKILVLDLYDPMHFEQLEQMADQPVMDRSATLDLTTRVLNDQLIRGDFFLCASAEQRNLWLGQLAAMGRINPVNYDRDKTLDSLIAICPFGLPNELPTRTGPGLRAVDGIGSSDKVLLWAGGVYNWFDPLTLVRAVDRVRKRHDNVRLFFLGMKHPNPGVPAMQVAWQTRQLADELALTGTHVFFNEGWVPYDDRANFLLDADAGVSTHLDHVETAFSFRTRILDYIWAGLPIISTGGDTFGNLVGRSGLGVRVDAQDEVGLIDAIESMLYDDDRHRAAARAVAEIRPRFTWDVALAPLVEFCHNPRRAADAGYNQRRFARHPVVPQTAVGRQLLRGTTLLREGGFSLLMQQIQARTRRVVHERRQD